LPLSKHFKLFRNQKNLDYTQQLISPLADVKQTSVICPLKTINMMSFYVNVLEHIPDDTKAMQELYRVLKPGGMAILQIPQELSRAVTFLMIQ
jgi:2-polyprenyl-3-methyl-5-hydroxy-6-metoxy-1,4-benzoquinol methylase